MQADVVTIKKRAIFVRMNSEAVRFVTPNFILQMQADGDIPANSVRVGYTVTKKIGGAVVRNLVKRRLREAMRRTSQHAKGGNCYVFIARSGIVSCDFSRIERDMEFAFKRIKAK